MRILGIILLALYAGFTVMMFLITRRRGPEFSFFALLAIAFYIVPGAAYLVLPIFMQQGRVWAVVGALILASIQFLYLLVAVIWMAGDLFNGRTAIGDKSMLIGIAVTGVFVLLLGRLLYDLVRSFAAIKHLEFEERRGFEPLMNRRIDRLEANSPDHVPPG
jgi:hypothetical protein